MKKRKNTMLRWVVTLSLLLSALIATVIFVEVKQQKEETNRVISIKTWEEYEALSLEDQDVFFSQFDSREAFEAWMEEVKPAETTEPILEWNKQGMLPNEYSWDEYQQLTAEERNAFFLWFDSEDAFEAWAEAARPTETQEPTVSWDEFGKKPDEFTWEEYQALTIEQQDAFYRWFESKEAFEAWFEREQITEPEETIPAWNRTDKLPSEYTWEEYQELTPEEQDAFYNWFESEEAFVAWLEAAEAEFEATKSTTSPPQWDESVKLPNEYTWEEYQQLPPEKQEAFFNWFGSVEAFEVWMESVKPSETIVPTQEWNKGGKLPNEYTWDEYQQLTREEQDAFFNWFDSVEAFEAWMNAARGQ